MADYYVYSGGTGSGISVNASDRLTVFSGGTASSATVKSYGSMTVSSGGTASSTTVSAYGSMTVSSGGTASSTTVSGYSAVMTISSGRAGNTSVSADGRVYVYSGGSANSTTVNGSGSVTVFSGGTASRTAVSSGGSMLVSSGGTAKDTVVVNSGRMEIYNRGRASGTIVSGYSAVMTISSGGTANRTAVSSGGSMLVSSGGTAVSAAVNSGGSVIVSSGGTAVSAVVNSGGSVIVSSGGTANSAAVNACGSMTVSGGGRVSGTAVSGCSAVMTVSSGGTANHTTVGGGNAVLYVYGGGTARNISVEYCGSVVVYGGKLTGVMNFDNGASVTAYSGSIVDFDISGRAAGRDALVNDLSRVYGDQNFTITVSARQATGKYRLAEGAAEFGCSVTVRLANDTALGTLSVGGRLAVGGKTCALAKESAALTLAIYEVSVVTGGFSGGASSEVLMHDFDGTLTIFDHQTGGSAAVGALDRDKWSIRGAGDYSHTGCAEVLLQNLETNDVYLVGDAAAGITEEKVTQSTRLGIVSGGYELGGVGNFNGSNHPGVLLTAPEQVSPGFSKVTGLACWTLDNAFNMSPGWLGAMVTTWDGGLFTIAPADLTSATDAAINAKYYSFELIGTGDFNGDGRDDVMIRNNMPKTAQGRNITGSGDVFVFLTGSDISGYQEVNVAYTGRAADPWRLAGVGDLNGDGIRDAILQNTEDGGIAGWILDSSARYVSASGIGTLSASQSFAGVGDVNGDNVDDVLFTDVDGSLKAWTVANGAGTGLIALG